MKIIDQTPYRSNKGDISLLDKIKGSIKYGVDWVDELEAQQSLLDLFNKYLGNKFTLLRNLKLLEADVTIPMVLVGPPGIYVFNIVFERGIYNVKGDSWGLLEGERVIPIKVNLVKLTAQFSRALQMFLDRQGFANLPPVEAVLMAVEPGIHINSVRPIVRIVMRDAIDRFAVSLTQSRIIFSPEAVQNIVDRLTSQKLSRPEPVAPPPQEVAKAQTTAAVKPESDDLPDWDNLYGFKFTPEEEQIAESALEAEALPELEEQPESPAEFESPLAETFEPVSDVELDFFGTEKPKTYALGGLRFTAQQWALLGGILFVQLIILVVFFILIATS